MASNDYKHGYGGDGLVNGNSSSQDYDEKARSDFEVVPSKSKGSMGKDDPFGDETNSEVKYRTMAWWSVASSEFQAYLTTRLIACSQASGNEYAAQARDH